MFIKEQRLNSKTIREVLQKGKVVERCFLRVKYLKNNLEIYRFAVVVSNKIDKRSTKRNKIKRRIREALKNHLQKIKPSFDLVFLTKKEILDKSYKEIAKEVVFLLDKILKSGMC